MAESLTAADIRAARARLDETQTQFARRFGVDRSTVAAWEKRGLPSKGTARTMLREAIAEITKPATEGDGNVHPNVDGGSVKPAS